MKYIANPVEVDAFVIRDVAPASRMSATILKVGDVTEVVPDGFLVKCEDGVVRHATKEMCARTVPGPGDFWVIQEDGYAYLNPREVFLRKYSQKEDTRDAADRPRN